VSDVGRFRRKGFILIPVSAAARETVSSADEGGELLLQQWKPRNWKQHRKLFAILGNVVEATGEWPSVERLRFDLLRELGRGVEHVSAVDGTVHFIPDSMNAASMSKAEFERFYEDAMRWLTERYQCDPEMLTTEAA
jgi:hypothetical protein